MKHLYVTAEALSPPEAALLRVGRSFPISGCFCGSSGAGFRFAYSGRGQIKHGRVVTATDMATHTGLNPHCCLSSLQVKQQAQAEN
jgi:hypothetical protein